VLISMSRQLRKIMKKDRSVSSCMRVLAFTLIVSGFPGCSNADRSGQKATDTPEQLSFNTDNNRIATLAFSPDGRWLAGATSGKLIRVWNAQTGEVVKTINLDFGEVRALAFSPDGKSLAAGTSLGIPCWDTQTWALRWGTGTWVTLLGHSVAFSVDGAQVVSGEETGKVSFWDTTNGKRLRDYKVLDGPVLFAAFLADGRLLASGSSGEVLFKPVPGKPGVHTTQAPGAVVLVDASTGKVVRKIATIDNDTVHYRVAISQDGKLLATRGADDAIELWDAETGELKKSLKGSASDVKVIAMSPDGAIVASGGTDKTIRIWRIQTGVNDSSLTGHEGAVTTLAFAPDGARLASASEDKTLRLWVVK
jgi:WD40 repeat protein